MSLLALTLKSLEELHGGMVSKLFDRELKTAVADCKDRPGDKRPRVVTLRVSLTPNEVAGECETIEAAFTAATSLPKKQTRAYPMLVHHNDQISFSSNNAQDPRQLTFDDENEKQQGGTQPPEE